MERVERFEEMRVNKLSLVCICTNGLHREEGVESPPRPTFPIGDRRKAIEATIDAVNTCTRGVDALLGRSAISSYLNDLSAGLNAGHHQVLLLCGNRCNIDKRTSFRPFSAFFRSGAQ